MSPEEALQILKDWWIRLEPNDKRPKFDNLATNKGIEINGYRFYTPSGPNAYINAEKDNKSINVMSFGQPDNPTIFFNDFSENITKGGGGAANQKRKRAKKSRRVKRSKRSTRRRHRK